MRILRRSLAVTVVLGVAVAACIETEHLATTAQRTVVLMPGVSYDFGTVPLGMQVPTSPDPYFIIRANSETDDDYVLSITLLPTCGQDFSLDLQPPLPTSPAEVYCMGSGSGTGTASGALAPGSATLGCTFVDYEFGARFQPSSTGPQTCGVQVATRPKNGTTTTTTTIMLTGNGQAPSYAMTAGPSSINFGDVPLNSTSGAQMVTVKNTGGSTIHVGGTITGPDQSRFLVAPAITGPYSLDMNQAQTFSVSCQTGGSPGTYSASLVFTTGSAEGSLMQTVMLSCHAAATAVLVTPNPVNLGTHLMGDSATTIPVTIANTATVALTLDGFTFSGEPAGEVTYPSPPTGPVIVGVGSNTSVGVRYAPTTERDFGSLGTMVFTVNGMATSVPLVGGAHVGSIGTNPAALDFGAVCAGSTANLDLTIFANAGGDVTLSNPTGPSAPFTATLPATGRTLLAHHASEITLTATAAPPASETAGDHTDQILLQTNIPGQTSVPVGVHALVLAGGVSPSPGIVHFGPNDIGKPSPVQMVTLTNCGAGPLTLTDVGFAGDNAAEFAVVSPADVHVTIPTTMSQTFLVVMTAATPGAKAAQMMFSFPGGPQMVALDGTGVGGVAPGGTTDRETYYACSTGQPGGLAPAAFAALLLRRRRRRRAR